MTLISRILLTALAVAAYALVLTMMLSAVVPIVYYFLGAAVLSAGALVVINWIWTTRR